GRSREAGAAAARQGAAARARAGEPQVREHDAAHAAREAHRLQRPGHVGGARRQRARREQRRRCTELSSAGVPFMGKAIHIDDLAAPRLSEAQAGALAWGETVTVDFSEPAILDAARQRTGRSDFGPDDFRERLRVLREAWDGDPEMTRLHRTVLHGYLVRYASNRLLIQDTLRRHPEILKERIERPVIVVGLPRSGTTHMVNLLAADARLHSLPLWESYEPAPLPGEPAPGDETDPRYQRCAAAWAGMQQTTPLIAAMHPMNPDHIHEELELMGPDFASYNFEWLYLTPQWRDHYYAHDQTPHYEYMKNVLRL